MRRSNLHSSTNIDTTTQQQQQQEASPPSPTITNESHNKENIDNTNSPPTLVYSRTKLQLFNKDVATAIGAGTIQCKKEVKQHDNTQQTQNTSNKEEIGHDHAKGVSIPTILNPKYWWGGVENNDIQPEHPEFSNRPEDTYVTTNVVGIGTGWGALHLYKIVRKSSNLNNNAHPKTESSRQRTATPIAKAFNRTSNTQPTPSQEPTSSKAPILIELRRFHMHVAAVNAVCISGTFTNASDADIVATASDDGKVIVHTLTPLTTVEPVIFQYLRPIKSLALDSKAPGRRFAVGTSGGECIIQEKNWMGSRQWTLATTSGPVRIIQWIGNVIALADDESIQFYDSVTRECLLSVKIDGSVYQPVYFCRAEGDAIIAAFDREVKIFQPKLTEARNHLDQYAALTTDFAISGISCLTSYERSILTLSCSKEEPPELHMIDWSGVELGVDVLTIKGWEMYEMHDYKMVSNNGITYVLAPKDLICARIPTVEDNLEWYLRHGQFDDALRLCPSAARTINMHAASWHFSLKDFDQSISSFLASEPGKSEWEIWFPKFSAENRLDLFIPPLPTSPQLTPSIYEDSLLWLLNHDTSKLVSFIKDWRKISFDRESIVRAAEIELGRKNDPAIMIALAHLHRALHRPEAAFSYLLRSEHPSIFELVVNHDLYNLLEQNLKAFTQIVGALEFLVVNSDKLNSALIIETLRRNDSDELLFRYFKQVWRSTHLQDDHFDLGIDLYVEFDKDELLDYLRTCTGYNLEHAYALCAQHDFVLEQGFLLGRMGNNKDALKLMLTRLDNIDNAIEFAQEQGDDELWEDLIEYGFRRPEFIAPLFRCNSSHLSPMYLLQRIPQDMPIPQIRDALNTVIRDQEFQITIREGCVNILTRDMIEMMDIQVRTAGSGYSMHGTGRTCAVCTEQLYDWTSNSKPVDNLPQLLPSNSTVNLFFCGHEVHSKCIPSDVPTCPVCYAQVA